MNENFDPKKIINFNKDYYNILGIAKSDLPKSDNRQNKITIAQIIEKSYRIMARKCHPDFGGSDEAFLDLVRARRILEDPYLRKVYDQGYFDEFNSITENSDFTVDWNKVGTYRKNSPEDTTGFSLFLKICELKEDLDLTPAFYPSNEEHNYEWDWVINKKNTKLVLSIVNDESEVLRLTSSQFIEESLPFKIYLCIPNKKLHIKRKTESILNPNGDTLVNGEIKYITYSDFNLLETTNLDEAKNYLKNQLTQDLNLYYDNKLKNENSTDTKLMTTEEIKKFDTKQLQSILNMKTFEVIDDKNAADFLDKIQDEDHLKNEEEKPALPL